MFLVMNTIIIGGLTQYVCIFLVGFPKKKAIEIINALLYIYFDQDILSFFEDPITSQRWAIIETFAREFLKCQSIRFIPRAMMLRRRCTRFSINLSLSRWIGFILR